MLLISIVLQHGAETRHNVNGDVWGSNETGMRTAGDVSQSVREWVGTGVKGARMGGDKTEMPAVCSVSPPLLCCDVCVQVQLSVM